MGQIQKRSLCILLLADHTSLNTLSVNTRGNGLPKLLTPYQQQVVDTSYAVCKNQNQPYLKEPFKMSSKKPTFPENPWSKPDLSKLKTSAKRKAPAKTEKAPAKKPKKRAKF